MIERVAFALVLLFASAANSSADEIDGFGRTLADAKLDARQHALERLQEKLANREPPLDAWRPTLTDVERFLEGPGSAGPSVHVEPLGIQINWKLPVRFPTDEEMVLRDRQARRQFGSVVAALAAIAGLASWWGYASWQARRRERGLA